MSRFDQITRINSRSRRVPAIVFRLLLAWLLSALVLAVLVPALYARGVRLQAWIPWAVILAATGLCAVPDLVRRLRGR